MAFQSSINIELGFGIVGEMFTDSPYRVTPYELVSASASYNVVGSAFTVLAADAGTGAGSAQAQAGGTTAFAGILVNPKVYSGFGTSAGGTLASTLTMQNYQIGELLTMGDIVVAVPSQANVGDQLTYNTTTGVLGTVTPVIPASAYTGSQTTTVMTVSAFTGQGNIGVGSVFQTSTGLPVTVISLGTGTGGNGTYNVSASQSATGGAVTSVAPSGFALIPNSAIIRYSTTGSGYAVARLTSAF